MKKRCLAMILTLLMLLTGVSFAATETVEIMEEVLREDFETSETDNKEIPGYITKMDKGGSTMMSYGATDNPGDNRYTTFAVTEKPSANVFDISFDMCAEGHPASGTQFFYVQLNPSSTPLQIIIKSNPTNQFTITLNNANPSWINTSDDFFTDTPVNIRLSIDRAGETVTGYINGEERGVCTFAEIGSNIANIKTTPVTSIRIYRYRDHFATRFYLDNLVIANSVNLEYDPDVLEMNFTSQIDYSEATPRLILTNGTDSKYLGQDIRVSLISEEDASVTPIGSVTLEKAANNTASFSLLETLPTLPAGHYFVTLERYIGGVLKGAVKQQKLYIATRAQLDALPGDFSNLPETMADATQTVASYLPCFLTEEEITALLPTDENGAYTEEATNNLEFITKYFKEANETYPDVPAVQTAFGKAKNYLELKNAQGMAAVRTALENGNYLDSYLNDEIFTQNEAAFFMQFDTKRNDSQNPLLSDEAIAAALHYAYAMTALNVANRSEIQNLVNTYNDVFGIDLTDARIATVKADDLYAVLYQKNYTKISDVQADFSAKLQELVDALTTKKDETTEIIYPTGGFVSGGGGGGGGGGFSPVVKTPVAPQAPEVKPDEIRVGFTDTEGHWAESYINTLSEKGIVTGFEEGDFRPDNTLNRAELVAMLDRIIPTYNKNNVVNFPDVKTDDWYYGAVQKMTALGIIYGIDGSFMPYETVTREQLAVMIYRAIAPDTGVVNSLDFADAEEISAYAKEAISYLNAKNILSGFEDNTIRPKQETTRAQAVKLLAELLAELSA